MRLDNLWTSEQLWILKKRYPIIKNARDLEVLIGKSYAAIHTKATKLKLVREVPLFQPSTALPEEDKFISENYLKLPVNRIAIILSKTIQPRSETFVKKRMVVLNLIRPQELIEKIKLESRLKPGNIPANKGKKQIEFMSPDSIEKTKATRFKKGSTPPNRKPVGFERIDVKDGYTYVKMGEGMHQFKLKHRIIWEQNFGPIPENCNVQFKDGNRLNFSPDNLELKTKKENMRSNTVHNLPKPIAQVIQLRGALNRKINKHLKRINA